MIEYIKVCSEVFTSQRSEILKSRREIKRLKEDNAVLKAVISETSYHLQLLNETAKLSCPDHQCTSLDWMKNIGEGLRYLNTSKKTYINYSKRCQDMFKAILEREISQDVTDTMIQDMMKQMPQEPQVESK